MFPELQASADQAAGLMHSADELQINLKPRGSATARAPTLPRGNCSQEGIQKTLG
jgi:hypothetical protein